MSDIIKMVADMMADLAHVRGTAGEWAIINVPLEDKPVIDMGVMNPITTRYVGTIAFQGTDAQINEAMKKWLGGVK